MAWVAHGLGAGVALMALACATAPRARAPEAPSASSTAAPAPVRVKRAIEPIEVIDLPAPRLDGEVSLERTLAERVSVRNFTDHPLSLDQISQLLWAAQGITHPRGRRTAPSAGAKFPLEVYVATREHVLHYVPEHHRAEVVLRGDKIPALAKATFQDFVPFASTIFVIAAVHERVRAKYKRRFARYVRQETGHASQNILLQAVALDLGAVTMGGFRDKVVSDVLGLPSDHAPEYLILVGYPGPRRP